MSHVKALRQAIFKMHRFSRCDVVPWQVNVYQKICVLLKISSSFGERKGFLTRKGALGMNVFSTYIEAVKPS